MERRRQFLITQDRILGLGLELATLLHSHESMCSWLGPYDSPEATDDDFLAAKYKEYHEERVSYLIITLAILLRTLDDRGEIGQYTKFEEPKQTGLGRQLRDGSWREITNFRTALNALIHHVEVIPKPEVRVLRSSLAGHDVGREGRMLSMLWTITNDTSRAEARRAEAIELDLIAFCDIVFRVAEDL